MRLIVHIVAEKVDERLLFFPQQVSEVSRDRTNLVDLEHKRGWMPGAMEPEAWNLEPGLGGFSFPFFARSCVCMCLKKIVCMPVGLKLELGGASNHKHQFECTHFAAWMGELCASCCKQVVKGAEGCRPRR